MLATMPAAEAIRVGGPQELDVLEPIHRRVHHPLGCALERLERDGHRTVADRVERKADPGRPRQCHVVGQTLAG